MAGVVHGISALIARAAQVQYDVSLAQWFSALAQASFGKNKHGDATNLEGHWASRATSKRASGSSCPGVDLKRNQNTKLEANAQGQLGGQIARATGTKTPELAAEVIVHHMVLPQKLTDLDGHHLANGGKLT